MSSLVDREETPRTNMGEPKTLVQGTLDMLVLKTLALEPMHGWGIAQRIEQISGGVFQINAGSLFPAFRRLERDGLVRAEWRATENNRRAKYYTLTETGRRQLRAETRDWESQAAAITRILRTSPGEI
ncbi:MAG TPA: PadR family transcriptional regulator [Vicinamibacterales bacterium]|nr:PadR family transcriptional regulator [Vicinamibacterales bacterium]